MKHYVTEPPCAFVEAVVAGYSPIDKWTCHFARVAQKMRAEPWWGTVARETSSRGSVRGDVRTKHGRIGFLSGDSMASGEIPWRTLHHEHAPTTAG